jgi:hypothetical protein
MLGLLPTLCPLCAPFCDPLALARAMYIITTEDAHNNVLLICAIFVLVRSVVCD